MVRLPLCGSVIRYYLEENRKTREKDGYLTYGTDNGSFSYALKSAVKACFHLCARSPPFSGFAVKI